MTVTYLRRLCVRATAVAVGLLFLPAALFADPPAIPVPRPKVTATRPVPAEPTGPRIVETKPSVQREAVRPAPFGTATEEDLLKALRAVPEVSLTAAGLKTLAKASPADAKGKHALETLLEAEAFKRQLLPFDFGPSCLSETDHARALETHSAKLRPSLRFGGNVMERAGFLLNFGWVRAETVPTRIQMLMAEQTDWRLALVEQLALTPGPEASRALANRAVFDLSPEVRTAATKALSTRPRADYADTLTRAFRYPWPPIADHAAQATAELKLQEAKASLERMLDLPDPAAPSRQLVDGTATYFVPEMVRVNHLKNCLLCHQRSAAREGLVNGGVPDWDQPLSPYDDPGGSLRVRADVVYLRQDFSVTQPVAEPKLWPREQRHDYFHRARPLGAEEAAALEDRPANRDYPQRDAVRYALRALEGKTRPQD